MIFRIVLLAIGSLLAVASRLDSRLRSQITRDMTVTISSSGGPARSFVFRDRRVSSFAGTADDASLVVIFPNVVAGVRVLVASDAVLRIVRGLSSNEIALAGSPTHLLWFYEMVTGYLPWRRANRSVMPDRYVVPDLTSKVASRIVREPPVAALDKGWTDAILQRDKLDIWTVGRGALPPGRIVNYRHVVAVTSDGAGGPG